MLIRLFIGVAFSFILTTASAEGLVCHDSADTIKERDCMSTEVDKADKKLSEYIEAAKDRISEDSTVMLSLTETQKAWLSYRTAHCGDVYAYWSQGTYRYRASLQCMLDLTKERTHDIWSAYLTYVDSSAAILPEP
jgi:uncharacterized protein YecT (DUF1311 family)